MIPDSVSDTPAISALPDADPMDVLQNQSHELAIKLSSTEADLTVALSERNELYEKLKSLQENPFINAMAYLDVGLILETLGTELTALCELVQKRKQSGKLALVLTAKHLKGDSLTITAEPKVTEPKEEAAPSVFYINDGELTRRDPRQRELFPE